MAKLWGGRFVKDSDDLMEDFHSSISFDQKLYYWDIKGSQAHAQMLGAVGVITEAESQCLIDGLEAVLNDIEEGHASFNPSDEDIHMNIEVLLTEKVGEVGKKLHTGRSRNDQVALDLRMYLRNEVSILSELYIDFLEVLLTKAKAHTETIMPGYTHLQRAQPITFAHHLLAYIEMFSRDLAFLSDWKKNHNIMPLGSGALAGTTFPLDRLMTARLLGFDEPCLNSLDGVSDRDFALDFLYLASRSMMHLTRFSEEIILWSSQEFSFIVLDDAYSTGSSIMPQKKNPDVAELVRGKSGRVYGNLMSLLTTMKGLPLAYNKDMQEDKECIFDTVETIKKCIIIFSKMIETMTVNKDTMKKATREGFANATDLADYLVKKGLPFRDAHRVVGEMVFYCIQKNKALDDLTIDEMKSFHALISEDIYQAINIFTCVNERNTIGGPSKRQVEEAILRKESFIQSAKEKL